MGAILLAYWLTTRQPYHGGPLLHERRIHFCKALLVWVLRYLSLLHLYSQNFVPNSGDQNDEADGLSLPQFKGEPLGHSLASVIAKWSQLQTCRICLLPFELLAVDNCIHHFVSAERQGPMTTT